MNIYGYARVNAKDQNAEYQLLALAEAGVDKNNVYRQAVGQGLQLPTKLRASDPLYILSIDRLGCNYEKIQNQWRVPTKDIGVNICVIDTPLLDTRRGKDLMGTFIADMVLQILSFVAQSERTSASDRQGD